jgi:GNAT superfamily N-acetyltransferase
MRCRIDTPGAAGTFDYLSPVSTGRRIAGLGSAPVDARSGLAQLLQGNLLRIYLLRSELGEALGFCEFDRSAFPQIELKNFGIVPEARGRRLGPWLLSTALVAEWSTNPARIWLHTDTWDHPAAIRVYETRRISHLRRAL